MRLRLVACLAFVLPGVIRAQQEKPCAVVFTGVASGRDTTSMKSFTTPTGGRNIFVGGGVDATCEGQGNRLLADSAEHYTERGELILIQRVRYADARMTMQSDRMIYYTADDRLLATGNVRGRTAGGTRFTGPQMEYLRAKPGVRTTPRWRATGRPFVRMAPNDAPQPGPGRDTTAADSVDLTADVVISENDSLVWAVGKVVIERPDVRATADSATLDQGVGFARLLRGPTILGRAEHPFSLVGTVLDLWSRNQRLERVLAQGSARAHSDSLVLTGDTIDLRFREQQIERAIIWGTRAAADARDQQMQADSLDVWLRQQRLRELHAIGRAIAYSTVDTSRMRSEERDWIAGDTIVAHFDTLATGDTTSGTRMREVTATGAARAFYQIAPSAGTSGAPTLSYNRGRVITVSFREGAVQNVRVRESASGIFLEPLLADRVRSDSATSAPKTAPGTVAPTTPASVPPITPATAPPARTPVRPKKDRP